MQREEAEYAPLLTVLPAKAEGEKAEAEAVTEARARRLNFILTGGMLKQEAGRCSDVRSTGWAVDVLME